MKKKFNLKKEYLLSWKYIKDSRNFIFSAIFLFFLFSLIGLFIPPSEIVRIKLLEIISNLMQQTEGMNSFELIRFIFLNNFQSSFFSLFLGILFCIFPVMASVFNGYLLGFVLSLAIESGGVLSIWKLLPHGIFELPAIFISFGLGLKLGTFIFYKEKIIIIKNFLQNSFRVFILIIIPLLIVAAIIEGALIFLVN